MSVFVAIERKKGRRRLTEGRSDERRGEKRRDGGEKERSEPVGVLQRVYLIPDLPRRIVVDC
jgi:hypothetical protein